MRPSNLFRQPAALFLALSLPLTAAEPLNLDAIHKIRDEAQNNSKVMETLFYLTEVNGGRLTNSPAYFKTAEWAAKQLSEWGIPAKLENWGPYGRGWEFTNFTAALLEPSYTPLIGAPLAYTSGTNGAITAEVTIATLANDADLEKYKGKLKDKIVLQGAGRDIPMLTAPQGTRYTDQQLAALAVAPEANGGGNNANRAPGAAALAPEPNGRGGNNNGNGNNGAPNFTTKLNKFLADEGVLAVLRIGGARGQGGTVFAQGGGSRDIKDPVPPPIIAITPEHYNRIARLLDHKIPVKVQLDLKARFVDDRNDSANVIGEIKGTTKADEIVMVGAHLDSWHAGDGATDNAAGSAVMMEALRILKTLNLPLARTVRIGLWSGEEQGLLGSRAYVAEHFAAREDMKLKPEHSKFSAYFNVDNGSGKIRGIYLQGNDALRPVFEDWLKPLADLGATTVSIRNTGGTDHQSFDAVGLPGFQFIQDPLEYDARTHHSNMDTYDRVQRADMIQMAAVVASFIYNAANRDTLLTRKPLPKPQPARPAETTGTATPATAQ